MSTTQNALLVENAHLPSYSMNESVYWSQHSHMKTCIFSRDDYRHKNHIPIYHDTGPEYRDTYLRITRITCDTYHKI